jgi:hypothetical protein
METCTPDAGAAHRAVARARHCAREALTGRDAHAALEQELERAGAPRTARRPPASTTPATRTSRALVLPHRALDAATAPSTRTPAASHAT